LEPFAAVAVFCDQQGAICKNVQFVAIAERKSLGPDLLFSEPNRATPS
jgi:hypothetical protein